MPPQKTNLPVFILTKYFKIMLNELSLELYYLSNDNNIVIFYLKLTES